MIGSGIGGIACSIRLQSLGFATTILEKLADVGGRAYVRRAQGFTFDMGPTVLTVPHFIEELFALERYAPMLDAPDFPAEDLAGARVNSGVSGGPHTSRYVKIVPVSPCYRIYFHDGAYFDYDGDSVNVRAQIARLGALQPLFTLVKKYFKSDKMRQVFSFEPLLVGGNLLKVPAIYAMIHFVEKTWGVHFAMGGTGALVRGLVRKLEELGGVVRLNSVVVKFRKQSMSLVVVYFGYRMREEDPDLRHHNIILGPRYEELLTDIFERKLLAFLDERGYIPDLRQRLAYHSFITPDYFEGRLDAYAGNGFGVEPRLMQTAFFRPHNRSEDVANLCLVGQGTQPGGGTPSVMMSAKMTAREIANDFAITLSGVAGLAESRSRCRTGLFFAGRSRAL